MPKLVFKRWIHLPARWFGIPSKYLNAVAKKGPQGPGVATRERDILKQRHIYIHNICVYIFYIQNIYDIYIYV